jgi:hypothetical protein
VSTTTGTLLGGRYRLDHLIAAGGMGEVWRAHDETLGRTVAVKLMHAQLSADPGFLARFRGEARNTAALSHPGIATVHDYGEVPADGAGTRAYLVMQLVEGQPLSDLLATEGRLTAARALDVVAQVASALAVAHAAGVVHRDIKPANLLVRPDGTVVVTDFGIARTVGSVGSLTVTGEVMGTASYLAPEQAAGRPPMPATDVYSLGVVAYECLAGRRPFEGGNPVMVALSHLREEAPPLPDDVPVPARALVARAMAKDPADRFPSVTAMAEAARAAARTTGDSPRPDTAAVGTAALPNRAGPPGAAALPTPTAPVPTTALPNTALPNTAPPNTAPPRGRAGAGAGHTAAPGAGRAGVPGVGRAAVPAPPFAAVPASAAVPSSTPVGAAPRTGARPIPLLRRPTALVSGVAAGVVVALLLGVGITALLHGTVGTTPDGPGLAAPITPPAAAPGSPTRSAAAGRASTDTVEAVRRTTTPAAPPMLTLRPGDYVGLTAAQARAKLQRLDLRVAERVATGPWPGRVTGLSPTRVRAGDTVTLSVAGWGRQGPKGDRGTGHGKGHGNWHDEDQQGDD